MPFIAWVLFMSTGSAPVTRTPSPEACAEAANPSVPLNCAWAGSACPVRIILPKQTMSDGRVDEYGRKSDQNTELDCIFYEEKHEPLPHCAMNYAQLRSRRLFHFGSDLAI
ncbi:hypothetical protein [Mesorhizobium sp.]|uniref:hypothetical protein n=1 Tax=Mesorhizobium sp. TaxID=1871066 RepID=UPI000FE9991A|nr:hypothetical protein [Mesorhizobium sp.]RWE57914.1 MAG: hypothetical protein EOS67_10770 [Mesorhizobium sp.]